LDLIPGTAKKKKKKKKFLARWYTPVIPTLKGCGKTAEFEASLDYTVSLFKKKKKKIHIQCNIETGSITNYPCLKY
jgi:hypothetical protein